MDLDEMLAQQRRDSRKLRVLTILTFFPPTTLFFINACCNLKFKMERESDDRQREIMDSRYEAKRKEWIDGGRVGRPPRPEMYPYKGVHL